jgi:hypothetical protein
MRITGCSGADARDKDREKDKEKEREKEKTTPSLPQWRPTGRARLPSDAYEANTKWSKLR